MKGELSMTQVDYLSPVDQWLDFRNAKKLYINGEWLDSIHKGTIAVINPATGEEITKVSSASQEDVELAILAARDAFDNGVWRSTAPRERAKLLMQLASKIEENFEELAVIETVNNGKTLKEARGDVEGAIETFQYYAGLATKPSGETFDVGAPFTSKVVREPIGVCGQIIPWNYPLLMAAWKLAPALAAGNTCILKPSELTPLTCRC
jgi:betaine-aldehyde dehydrogenase